ncbi:MAG: nickel ABC transporter substrate-binding protein [Pseudomonadota bacterium]
MKKVLALFAAICVFATAHMSYAQEVRKDLTFAFFRDMESLSPHTTAGEMWFQEAVYETLVSVENSGIEPCLAESWEISEDGRTYTFHMRKGVKFTDGVVMDAYVIEKNFDNIFKDKNSLKWLESINLTESYKALDADTFQVVLKQSYYPYLTELGITRPYAIGSPSIFVEGEPRKVTGAVGTGPYYLADRKLGEYVVMKANKDYWGPKATIETVTMKVIPEGQTRVMALENGEIDMVFGINVVDAATIQIYKDSQHIKYALSTPTLTKHFVINSHLPGLNDINVRKAIQHAIHKEAIAQGLYYGIEKPADALFSPTIPYCDVDLKPYEYDMDKAAKLLDDAGWVMGKDGIRAKDGVKLSFTAIYDNNSVTCKPIFEFLQSELDELGIHLKLAGYERSTYFDMQKGGTFDIIMGVPWGQPYDPHTALSSFRAPSYGDHKAISGLPNGQVIFDEIQDFITEVDPELRQEKIAKVLTDIHEGATHVPLVYESNKSIFISDIKEVTFAPSPYVFQFWNWRY